MYSREAAIAASSWLVLRLAAVKPHIRVVAVTTGPSKQETEGGGGGEATIRGGALTKASSTLLCRPEEVLAGVGDGLCELKELLGPGAGTATTVAAGPVGVIGAGAAASIGIGLKGAGAGADTEG